MTIDAIKKALISSCLKGKGFLFIPFLLSPKVVTSFPNKWRFYSFFSEMVCCTKKNAIGDLELKIENTGTHRKNQLEYCFYDKVHKHPRLNIIVEEKANSIFIDVFPF